MVILFSGAFETCSILTAGLFLDNFPVSFLHYLPEIMQEQISLEKTGLRIKYTSDEETRKHRKTDIRQSD